MSLQGCWQNAARSQRHARLCRQALQVKEEHEFYIVDGTSVTRIRQNINEATQSGSPNAANAPQHSITVQHKCHRVIHNL